MMKDLSQPFMKGGIQNNKRANIPEMQCLWRKKYFPFENEVVLYWTNTCVEACEDEWI